MLLMMLMMMMLTKIIMMMLMNDDDADDDDDHDDACKALLHKTSCPPPPLSRAAPAPSHTCRHTQTHTHTDTHTDTIHARLAASPSNSNHSFKCGGKAQDARHTLQEVVGGRLFGGSAALVLGGSLEYLEVSGGGGEGGVRMDAGVDGRGGGGGGGWPVQFLVE